MWTRFVMFRRFRSGFVLYLSVRVFGTLLLTKRYANSYNQGWGVAAIEEAGEAALGRKIKVVAGFDDDLEAAEPDSSADSAPEARPSDPGRVAEQRRDDLWNRAEAEPMVQQFIDALRGNLTDVEEI